MSTLQPVLPLVMSLDMGIGPRRPHNTKIAKYSLSGAYRQLCCNHKHSQYLSGGSKQPTFTFHSCYALAALCWVCASTYLFILGFRPMEHKGHTLPRERGEKQRLVGNCDAS